MNNKNDTTIILRTCVVVGGTRLAVYCAELIQASGHSIQAVLATDTVMQTWASQQGIVCVDSVEALQKHIILHPVDWLFSIVNPLILPVSLITLIRNGAFNYHDSPLPRYAGHHATSWALLDQAKHYAISWHRIESSVDTGDIAVQLPVSIEDNDSAFSLNLKCYQTAQKGFAELLNKLSQDTLVTRPQDLSQRRFYASSHRPDAGGYLCWEQSAEMLSALVRALDFGENYDNPLGRPKLLLEHRAVTISWLQPLTQRSEGNPGTLIRVEDDIWRVTTGSEDVCIGGFATLEGQRLSARELADIAELKSGKTLPVLSSQQRQQVKNTLQALAPSESFWQRRLAAFQPVRLPFASSERSSTPCWMTSLWQTSVIQNETDTSSQTLLQAFVIYLARLTQQSVFQIGWCTEVNDDLSALSPVVPMEIEVAPDKPWHAVANLVNDELTRLAQHRTFSRDLCSRSPSLRAIPALQTCCPWPIAVSITQDDIENAIGELLTFQINAQGEFRWIYDENRLNADVILRMSEQLQELLSSKRKGDEIPVGKLNLLPAVERTLLLETWNATERAYPDQLCIHQLFELQVEKNPDAIALVHEEHILSYAELNTCANRLAHQLIASGIEPDQRVAICMANSPLRVMAVLAVLKAGGAYVPLDPAYSGERLSHILTDVAPEMLLADSVGRAALGEQALTGLTILDPTVLPDQPDSNPQVTDLTSRHLAYVIYTSGSTGTPKGVMVEHQSWVNLALFQINRFNLDNASRVLQFASLGFDASVWEIMMALGSGACLVIPNDRVRQDPRCLWQYLETKAVTHACLTPSLLRGILDLPALTIKLTLILAGETPSPALFQALSGQVLLFNAYGPTEGTVCATVWHCPADYSAADKLPIGRPIDNARVYLLDTEGQPVPLGAVGDLYIGGVGVARGYLNRPELTAERFLIDPFSNKPGARMYRTGDLARYLPDGNLEFMGRNDHQVKIRGFRIELGETEARLREYPAVREAAVLALGEESDKRLVAYVVADADKNLANNLRTYLSAILPHYMMPTAFVRLDAFPLTPNGKLDRGALPAPDSEAFARQLYEAPQGEKETVLAAIWSELLGIEQISRHDNFFALGGHSLLAVKVIECLYQRGITLAIRNLFLLPVLSELAQTLEQQEREVIPANVITPDATTLTPAMLPLIDLTQTDIDCLVAQVPGGLANIQDIYALSPLQDGILFHHLLANEGDPYLLTLQMAFENRALLDRYLAALQQVINRHDILRTAFFWQGLSVPVQVVCRHAPLSVLELNLAPADGSVSEQLVQRFDSRHYRLVLNQAPLLRIVMAQEADGRWIVLALLHHLIGDHTTLEMMHRDVKSYLDGQEASLPAPMPFRNLVAQARLGGSEAEHSRFFTDMLADVEEPTLPFGLAEVHRDGSQVTESHRMLAPALNARLRAQAQYLGVSLAALCHLAWAQVLARTSGQKKVVFGTVLLGRMVAGEGTGNGMGMFINTLPLQLDMDGSSVQDSVKSAHTQLAELLTHEHASLVLAQRCSGVDSTLPLFSALLNYRHNDASAALNALINGVELLELKERTNYPFVLSVEDFGDALGLTAQVVHPFDPEQICGYMQQALESLAAALEFTPNRPVRELDILPERERSLLLTTWNTTETLHSEAECIHQLFEQHAKETPDAIALVCHEQSLSYAELNIRANRLAHQLITLGIEPEQRVALCVSRSSAMVVGVLAILKSGGAYVPLDPVYSSDRLAHILADADPTIVLADPIGQKALGEHALAGRTVLDPNISPDQPGSNPQVAGLTAGHLAYVIYTSGSTGTPKGVMVEHRNILRLFDATQAWYHFTRQDVWCLFHSLSFDFSVWELWGALRYGAKLVLVPHETARSPQAFHQWVCRHGITVLNQTPSAFKAFIASYASNPLPDQLRYVIFGGETLDPGILLPWYRLRGEISPQLVNMYGITETTVHVTYRVMNQQDVEQATSPIGQRIADLTLYLLDDDARPVPLGAVGELYVGGAGVARGYLNRPELTAERFLVDPFSDKPAARMYRTGDLGRYRPDGSLEFLGRNDQQVKIRGFRIEPGEIEARLREHALVRDAVVLAQGEGQDKRLVAYVVAEEAMDAELTKSLHAHLSRVLPDYMIPAAFVRLASFPLTPNGKLDHRSLPEPDSKAFVRQRYEPPQGETETALAAIWCELLGIGQISRHDNFFALGGHSLLAVRLMNRIASQITGLGAELPLSALFNTPSLAALAEEIQNGLDAQNNVLPVITAVSREGLLPLSFAQQRLWLLTQFEGMSETYHIPIALRLRGQLDITAFQQALNTLFARHEALRSVFISVDGQPQIQLLPTDATLPLAQHDLRGEPDVKMVFDQLCTKAASEPFELSRGPLIRAMLIRLSDDDYHFLLTQHHIVADGWSLNVLARELSALYTAYRSGDPDPLPPLALQYPDYAVWQHQWLSSEHIRMQSDYWRAVMADAPVLLDLPTDRPRPVEQSFSGQTIPLTLDAELTAALKQLSAQNGVTLFMTVLSAWSLVLSRLSGQTDIVIGTPSAGRNRQEIEPLIGFFVNTLALRLDISSELTVAELLAQVRKTALAAQAHQDLPFEQVVEIVQLPRQLTHSPLFQVMFAWQNNERSEWKLPGLDVSPIEQTPDVAKFDLELTLSEEGDRIVGMLNYASALFDRGTIERHLSYLSQALQKMAAAPRQLLRNIDILPPSERQLLLENWNATAVPYPESLCIHQLVEQQAENKPEAIALVYEEQHLSYAELNACANRLAHQLIALGVGPEQRVVICVSRSPAMVVGLLAVLKAGGAYVPLDPAYSGERLAQNLADADPVLVLADNVGLSVLGKTALAGRTVLDPNIVPAQPDNSPRITGLTSRHLAYVIYTSGSTGTPKGVMVEHQGWVNLTLFQINRFNLDSTSRVLQFASLGFDASAWEIMMALGCGACLVIPNETVRQDPRGLWQYLETNAVTHACLTPSLLRGVTELSAPTLKLTLILGGETPDPALFQALSDRLSLSNAYGPTEATICATVWHCPADYSATDKLPIGRPIDNTRIYLLDTEGQPIPLGAVGELYIGGVGVARGYLNRPELTAERFLIDPFSNEPDARMYRTGDLARYLPDGNLEFMGRNDHQVKIRGFRIELGEIEARLREYPAVREAMVLVQEEESDKRLVAYVVTDADKELANNLRAHLSAILPDYMIPSAFVCIEAFPLTPNGKLDHRSLPEPDIEAFARQNYELPQGETEIMLAAVWREVLGIEHISRYDNFFALGGHSLLAVRMIERLHQRGMTLGIRDLFQSPVLSALAQTLGQHQSVLIPANIITPDTTMITPAMLPLVDLTQAEIDHIVGQVPGGVANIQDIYPLSPLQDGILFHHLLAHEGDPYLLVTQMAFAERALLDRYLAAVQQVVNRHDILRTAFLWQELSVPVQVVWRQAALSVLELNLNPADGPVEQQLARRFNPRHYRLDLNQAPLLRFVVAQEADGRWIVLQLLHHLVGDHTTMEIMHREVLACLDGQETSLPTPEPFRNSVAQARLGVSEAEHTRFFTEMLADVEEPTLPFGLTEVYRDGSQVTEFHRMLPPALNVRLRNQAKNLGVSLAALCHLAWAQVLSCISGQEKVIFGTVLFGRMAAGKSVDNGMGLFINTLPLRLDMNDVSVRNSVQIAHTKLAELLVHEHASLALAQKCSGIDNNIPLFSALLNYRHNSVSTTSKTLMEGIEFLGAQERTNYPLVLSIEDFGESLGLTAQIVRPFEPERICGYMQQALESLVAALENAPGVPVRELDILPETERRLLLATWNETDAVYPAEMCIHQLFERQAEKTPHAAALVHQEGILSYTELNTRANRLAHQLIKQGICAGQHVALQFERSVALVVAQLAVLKAGAVYVPIDPDLPDERKQELIRDSAACLLITDIPTDAPVALLCLTNEQQMDSGHSCINPDVPRSSADCAYIMYTSGSTGTPKGVLVPHRAVVRLVINNGYADIGQDDRVAFMANPAFDASTFEIWSPLLNGGTMVVIDHHTLLTPAELVHALETYGITVMWLTVGLFNQLAMALSPVLPQIKCLIVGGDALDPHVIRDVLKASPPQQLLNGYGPTEGTTFTTTYAIQSLGQEVTNVPIGRPIANTRVYLLNAERQPVPLGAVGELYIGGDGVACGYFNRPELTAERFLIDPFSDKPDARMYRSGDLARYLPDGNLEFLGRNDQQVKIRGFRIELGEIEVRLAEHPAVREATVRVLGDGQEKRLVAYIIAEASIVTETRIVAETNVIETTYEELVNTLRTHLSTTLPDYMIPAAFVRLERFPLTPNGKLDRHALPMPDCEAFARQIYAAPQGETETVLAAIWGELLGMAQISRYDNFFVLGGHSLLAVRMIERLRQRGLTLAVRDLFQSPVLSNLAKTLSQYQTVAIPTNVITPELTALTPAMLPLVDLTQAEIDHIVGQMPDGMANIQDIYPLSPLQDGILFHHLLAHEGDPYLLVAQMAFAERALLDRYLVAVQQVINRHDILRTAFLWQALSAPVQVVWRQAALSVLELKLNPADGSVHEQLSRRFNPRHYRLDLNQAPLLRFVVAQEADGRWIVLQLLHHLIGDHTTMEIMHREVLACLNGQEASLPAPTPFRNSVAQARLGISEAEHIRFFSNMLADVEEPTLPFGLAEVYRDGSQVADFHRMLPTALNARLRNQAKSLGVSLAALCHLAWAQVLSRISGQEKVVFGTVLFGRMAAGEGADNGMGLFINTLPLRLDMNDTSVRNSAQTAHTRLAELLVHEHASLALAQKCSGIDNNIPLFSALLNYRHNALPITSNELIKGIEFLGAQERTNYPLALSVEDFGDALGLTAQIVQPFAPERIWGYMRQALESLVEALERAPDMPVKELNILPETERRLLLTTWNETDAVYPTEMCIHQLFEQQVTKTPEAVALVYENQHFSYAQLNAHANRLAHQLIVSGIVPEQRVVLCVSRSPAMIVGLLAVLKTGGVYVPLDPIYSGERLGLSMMDADPVFVLADNVGRMALGEQALAGRTVFDPNCLPTQPDSNPEITGLTAKHLAYVIYTSGSTGVPKGVMVAHQSVVNLAFAQINRFNVDETSRVLQFASLGFDASVSEIMTALSGGACLIIPDDAVRQDPRCLWQYLEEKSVTHAFLTPSLLQGISDFPPLTAKPTLILAGEAPSAALLKELCGRVTLFNDYGPTEATVCATSWRCPPDYQGKVVSIGRPTANTRIYLLDDNAQPVPLGMVGEIYIGGDGVARGYLNRPELTAERFFIDPFNNKPDACMYRTGDMARYLPDGNLVFLGRNDQQVKIRGFRIEPGEIEARLSEFPSVRESVVLVLGEGIEKQLVAYIVVEPEGVAELEEALANSLRAHLSAILPDYMIPAAFVCLPSFPLTPNGKLDRNALPAPDNKAFARQIYAEPQGETETALAAIWRDVLGVEHISRHDNFFALGGHSLLAVRLINRIMGLGAELPLSVLFNTPLLAELAKAIDIQRETQNNRLLPAIQPVSREGILPLSFAQQRLWFLAQLDGVSETYHISIALRLRGTLDRTAWQQALNTLFSRHEALRSVFVSVDGQPQVRLLAADFGIPLSLHDLRKQANAGATLEQLYFEASSAPFELNRGPLIRAMLIRLADDDYQFLLTQHHIVSDGWSFPILIRELNILYAAYLAGLHNPLPPLAIQYPDYAVWQRQWFSSERIKAQSDYWRTVLAGVPVLLDLPTDRPRPVEQSFIGRSLPINLDKDLTTALKRLSRQHGTTIFMTLLSAWAVVLSRLSGQTDIVIGTPSAGRSRQEVESLIGFFVNTLALRLDISSELTVAELLVQVRKTTLAAQTHQDLPFEQVVDIVQPPRQLAHTPLFQVIFAWQNNESMDWELPGVTVSPIERDLKVVKFDLELNLYEREDKIVGELRYASALFDQQTIERHIGYLHNVLQMMAAMPQQRLRDIDILPPSERRLLLENWNATAVPYPESLCIHQLVEQQAENKPEAIALVYEEQHLSYAELNARANRLAHQLIALGVGPEQRVVICVSKSPAMVVGLLAVLKAGGAYVPLDPAYSGERLAQNLADADPVLVLADNVGLSALGKTALAGRTVLDPNIVPAQPDNNPRIIGLTSRHLAYVIYTSGSTGIPKGVMVEHQGWVNLTLFLIKRFNLGSTSRVLQFASLGFDVSAWEIMMALGCGACLVIPNETVRQDPRGLWQYLETNAVTHASLTPSLLRGISDELSASTLKLTLILGGETPDPALFQSLSDRFSLSNVYGPTEATICATVWHCPADYAAIDKLPIGRPIDNVRIYLLDTEGQPVPLGAVGELYIGGVGVARGYLNRPELTAERFLIDPFSNKPDARMYRTGDLARYLPDGNLEFMGRNDHQVKIRGFRIELGEIEARLREYPAVSDAVVLVQEEGGNKRLVAYVVAEDSMDLANRLRTHLSALLPDYMVPAAFVHLKAFPLTSNGKLDRRALPMPDGEAFARQAYVAPRGKVEIMLAAIWSELLSIEQISRHDNFFDLGGHSLLASQMINLAANQGIILTLNALFQFPVLAELAMKITSDSLSEPQSCAVPIRTEGVGLPLFFVPTGMGDHSYVFLMARYLQAGYPIYALPWPSINEEPMSTIEKLADRMIIMMKDVLPAGPYRISGYSSGGILAYVIAQKLLNAGEAVDFLGLIDTNSPSLVKKTHKSVKYHFFYGLAWQAGKENAKALAILHQRIDELSMVQFIEAAQELALYPANLRADVVAKRWEQIERYAQMVMDYKPSALPIILYQFYAVEPVPVIDLEAGEKSESESIEPSLGWADVIPEMSLRLIAVSGNHISMMEDNKNRMDLVEAMNKLLVASSDTEK
ncbi:non-ribosomal peptide synthase/polyketide synthase [Xenorhabdus santafensis]|nr:non-ribosomal peptide synthase/polyketide synthase [Xenorhabdus sp. 12]